MRLALIPPLSMLDEAPTEDGGYHLYLPSLCDEAAYASHIWRAGVHQNSYRILDNGAFEGEVTSPVSLFDIANRLGMDEIVIPDVLGDMHATLHKVDSYTEHTRHMREATRTTTGFFKHMAVVQGRTLDECIRCVDGLTEKLIVDTLGLPKHLVETVGRDTRIALTSYISDTFGDDAPPIHFLGQSPLWPDEIKMAKYFDAVRGMDTSMPFVYAYHGLSITTEGLFSRPRNYFNLDRDAIGDIFKENIALLREWMSA